jgi:hypothetical protein
VYPRSCLRVGRTGMCHRRLELRQCGNSYIRWHGGGKLGSPDAVSLPGRRAGNAPPLEFGPESCPRSARTSEELWCDSDDDEPIFWKPEDVYPDTKIKPVQLCHPCPYEIPYVFTPSLRRGLRLGPVE